MSFELFVQVHERGGKGYLPKESVRRLFPVVEKSSNDKFWLVEYGKRNGADIYVGVNEHNPELIGDLMVSRPCVDMRLWDALMECLRLGSMVMFWPCCEAPVVASDDVVQHLPPDMIEVLGRPVVVRKGEEIISLTARGHKLHCVTPRKYAAPNLSANNGTDDAHVP